MFRHVENKDLEVSLNQSKFNFIKPKKKDKSWSSYYRWFFYKNIHYAIGLTNNCELWFVKEDLSNEPI